MIKHELERRGHSNPEMGLKELSMGAQSAPSVANSAKSALQPQHGNWSSVSGSQGSSPTYQNKSTGSQVSLQQSNSSDPHEVDPEASINYHQMGANGSLNDPHQVDSGPTSKMVPTMINFMHNNPNS